MNELKKMTMEEVYAYYHYKSRHGHAPENDAELELAVMEDRTWRELYVATGGHIAWDKEQERFVEIP